MKSKMSRPASLPLLILLPVYNDFQSAKKLIIQLDNTLSSIGQKAGILIVDDGSPQPEGDLSQIKRHHITKISVIRLKKNVGHQAAIAVGLNYVYQHAPRQDVLVMDADGEDRPQDLPLLLSANNQKAVIFAQRQKRTESAAFILFYKIYKTLFHLFTGQKIFFGNFSLIPARYLRQVILVPHLWWHYAASVLHSRLPIITIPTRRGRRYYGKSTMNFNSLTLHGLRAFAVFSENIALRFLLGSIVASVIIAMLILSFVYIRLFTDLAIPGWTSTLILLLIIAFLQILLISFFSFFTIINSRQTSSLSTNEQLSDLIQDTA